MRLFSAAAASLALAVAARAPAAEPSLPLPDAPVRLVIPDAAAFDAALSGAFRRAALGDLDPEDTLVAAWRQSPVGSKLEAEWSKLASSDLPWTWTEIRRLQPRSVGLALLSAGALEAVMAIDTPLAVLPVTPPSGKPKTHQGTAYAVVASGAGDASGGRDERRMGLAWARLGSVLFLATSERALLLALDEAAAGRGAGSFLPGLASLELDVDRLREDRYFVREFLPGVPSERVGRVHAALRLEEGRLVEVREGRASSPPPPAAVFPHSDAAVAGWEPEDAGFYRALRAGLLEPQPALSERPVPALAPLPATATEAVDRYLVRLDQPRTEAGEAWEAGDLAAWSALLAQRPGAGWGFWADGKGARAMVFAWPEERQKELEAACRATLARRAGTVASATLDGVVELSVGPGLPALALRRTGGFLWIGTSTAAVAGREAPRAREGLVRWGRVDLDAARARATAWARAEGPAAPERVRPFSDRVLGLLGWVPSVRAIDVERRQAGEKWTERILFEER